MAPSGTDVEADVVRAGVSAAGLVGDPLHVCFGNQCAEVLEFAGAGLRVVACNGPDARHEECARREVGWISGDAAPCDAVACRICGTPLVSI